MQEAWDLHERALLALEALLKADERSAEVLEASGAAEKLRSISWLELEDDGYREELQQLHASVLKLLISPGRRNLSKDEL